MSIGFNNLPKKEKIYILDNLGLPSREHKILWLRYIDEMSYPMIAAEMCLSEKSVGTTLTRARKHAIQIARECFCMADDRCKMMIEHVDWSDSSSDKRLHNKMINK